MDYGAVILYMDIVYTICVEKAITGGEIVPIRCKKTTSM